MTDGMTPGQRDAFTRSQSGLFVPSAEGQPDAGDELAQRMVQMLVDEINAVTAWCKRWPKTKEKPLSGGDLMDLCLARARSYMWSRDFTEQVYRGAANNLGLVKKAPVSGPPPSRQQRRAEARSRSGERPNLRVMASTQPPPPAADPNYSTTAREENRGYAEFNATAEAEQLQQAAPFDRDQHPVAPEPKEGDYVPKP